MYCSTCGKTLNPGLSYCNNCGARIGSVKEESAPGHIDHSYNLLVIFLFITPIAGIGIIIGLMAAMRARLGFGEEMIGLVVIMSFFLLLVSELGLIWLLARRSKSDKKPEGYSQTPVPRLNEVVLKGLPANQAHSVYDGIPSVTEHTTKTLDPVPRKPKSG